jgi:hypothetical protein
LTVLLDPELRLERLGSIEQLLERARVQSQPVLDDEGAAGAQGILLLL